MKSKGKEQQEKKELISKLNNQNNTEIKKEEKNWKKRQLSKYTR